jgi:hypothetical protein
MWYGKLSGVCTGQSVPDTSPSINCVMYALSTHCPYDGQVSADNGVDHGFLKTFVLIKVPMKNVL